MISRREGAGEKICLAAELLRLDSWPVECKVRTGRCVGLLTSYCLPLQQYLGCVRIYVSYVARLGNEGLSEEKADGVAVDALFLLLFGDCSMFDAFWSVSHFKNLSFTWYSSGYTP